VLIGQLFSSKGTCTSVRDVREADYVFSELSVQFELPDSGIWNLDNDVSLPDSRMTWQFSPSSTAFSPLAFSSPGRVLSAGSASLDKVQSYFLAEIAMRRMLHRCTTAIRLRSDGKLVYAPVIAAELEYQLDEWYNYLPRLVRFEREGVVRPVDGSTDSALEGFLRTQYYACKASIYWPAVYQAIEFGEADNDLLAHCQKFFHSFVQFMTSVEVAIHTCRVNMWTLFTRYVSFRSGTGVANLGRRAVADGEFV
jgi:hypothetical protein